MVSGTSAQLDKENTKTNEQGEYTLENSPKRRKTQTNNTIVEETDNHIPLESRKETLSYHDLIVSREKSSFSAQTEPLSRTGHDPNQIAEANLIRHLSASRDLISRQVDHLKHGGNLLDFVAGSKLHEYVYTDDTTTSSSLNLTYSGDMPTISPLARAAIYHQWVHACRDFEKKQAHLKECFEEIEDAGGSIAEVVSEPARPITIWDHVLNEAQNFSNAMSSDFSWKLKCARILAEEACHYLLTKSNKESYLHDRQKQFEGIKHCKMISEMIRSFWSSMSHIYQTALSTELDSEIDLFNFPNPTAKKLKRLPVSKPFHERITSCLHSKQNLNPARFPKPVDSLKKSSSLLDYQIAGVNWLYHMFQEGFVGVFSDSAHSGKKVQILHLLKILSSTSKGKTGPHLILGPLSYLPKWEIEIRKFLPKANLLRSYHPSDEPGDIFLVDFDSFIEHPSFTEVEWATVIVDEGYSASRGFNTDMYHADFLEKQTLLNYSFKCVVLRSPSMTSPRLSDIWKVTFGGTEFDEEFSKLEVSDAALVLGCFLLCRDIEYDLLPQIEYREIDCELSHRQKLLTRRLQCADGCDSVHSYRRIQDLRKIVNNPSRGIRRAVKSLEFPSLRVSYPEMIWEAKDSISHIIGEYFSIFSDCSRHSRYHKKRVPEIVCSKNDEISSAHCHTILDPFRFLQCARTYYPCDHSDFQLQAIEYSQTFFAHIPSVTSKGPVSEHRDIRFMLPLECFQKPSDFLRPISTRSLLPLTNITISHRIQSYRLQDPDYFYNNGKLNSLLTLVEELLDDNDDESVIIFAESLHTCDMIHEFLNRYYPEHVYLDDRLFDGLKVPSFVSHLQASISETRIILASPRAAGIYLSLCPVTSVITYEPELNPISFLSLEQKIRFMNQAKDITVYTLGMKDSVDTTIYKALDEIREHAQDHPRAIASSAFIPSEYICSLTPNVLIHGGLELDPAQELKTSVQLELDLFRKLNLTEQPRDLYALGWMYNLDVQIDPAFLQFLGSAVSDQLYSSFSMDTFQGEIHSALEYKSLMYFFLGVCDTVLVHQQPNTCIPKLNDYLSSIVSEIEHLEHLKSFKSTKPPVSDVILSSVSRKRISSMQSIDCSHLGMRKFILEPHHSLGPNDSEEFAHQYSIHSNLKNLSDLGNFLSPLITKLSLDSSKPKALRLKRIRPSAASKQAAKSAKKRRSVSKGGRIQSVVSHSHGSRAPSLKVRIPWSKLPSNFKKKYFARKKTQKSSSQKSYSFSSSMGALSPLVTSFPSDSSRSRFDSSVFDQAAPFWKETDQLLLRIVSKFGQNWKMVHHCVMMSPQTRGRIYSLADLEKRWKELTTTPSTETPSSSDPLMLTLPVTSAPATDIMSKVSKLDDSVFKIESLMKLVSSHTENCKQSLRSNVEVSSRRLSMVHPSHIRALEKGHRKLEVPQQSVGRALNPRQIIELRFIREKNKKALQFSSPLTPNLSALAKVVN